MYSSSPRRRGRKRLSFSPPPPFSSIPSPHLSLFSGRAGEKALQPSPPLICISAFFRLRSAPPSHCVILSGTSILAFARIFLPHLAPTLHLGLEAETRRREFALPPEWSQIRVVGIKDRPVLSQTSLPNRKLTKTGAYLARRTMALVVLQEFFYGPLDYLPPGTRGVIFYYLFEFFSVFMGRDVDGIERIPHSSLEEASYLTEGSGFFTEHQSYTFRIPAPPSPLSLDGRVHIAPRPGEREDRPETQMFLHLPPIPLPPSVPTPPPTPPSPPLPPLPHLRRALKRIATSPTLQCHGAPAYPKRIVPPIHLQLLPSTPPLYPSLPSTPCPSPTISDTGLEEDPLCMSYAPPSPYNRPTTSDSPTSEIGQGYSPPSPPSPPTLPPSACSV